MIWRIETLNIFYPPTRFSALAGSVLFGSPQKNPMQAKDNPEINRIKTNWIAIQANSAAIQQHQFGSKN